MAKASTAVSTETESNVEESPAIQTVVEAPEVLAVAIPAGGEDSEPIHSDTLVGLPKPKFTHLPCKLLKVDPNIQIRFQTGESTFGFKVPFGDTKLNALVNRIREIGRVTKALEVWKRGDEYTVLCGNQRTLASNILLNDPNTSKELRAELLKLPCFVYEGLTMEQARTIVDDQSSIEDFTAVDVVNMVWKRMKTQWDYRVIGLDHVGIIAKHYLGTAQAKLKLAEVRNVPHGPDARAIQLRIVATWLRGSLHQTIMLANLMGERVRKAFLFTIAKENNLIKDDMEKPEFNPKTKSAIPAGYEMLKTDGFGEKTEPTRLAMLSKMKSILESQKKDWDTEGEGVDDPNRSDFHKLIDLFIQEDGKEKTKEKENRPTAKALADMSQSNQSEAFKLAYKRASGDEIAADVLVAADTKAFRCTTVMDAIEGEILPKVKPEYAIVAEVLAAVCKSNNRGEVMKSLAKFI